jgi:Flp pilus assembly protein TadG
MSFAAAKRAGILAHLRALAGEHRGIAALEFAALVPLFIILYLGTFEIGQGISINLNNALAARTVTDLASQYTSISNADMTNILGASSTVLAPFPTQPFSITVSEVTVDANGNATVTWSDTHNGTARSVGQSVTLPAGMNVPNSSLIWGETKYVYTPGLGYVLTGSINLSSQIFMAPRNARSVTRVNS